MKRTGFHVSIAGGLHRSFDNAAELGIDTFQIFLKNSTRWTAPILSEDEILLFHRRWKKSADITVHAHTGYLVNLAGTGENLEKSVSLMKDEMDRADSLGIKKIVLHPGSHMGEGIDTGINGVSSALNRILSERGSGVMILLETTAGQGKSVGHRFEHIRDIISKIKQDERIGVCFDTCHVFAAGYDISEAEGYYKTLDEFDRIIGLKKLELFHVNDSKKGCGTQVDRHEHIGLGYIGENAFKLLFYDTRFKDIDKILETPVDEVRDDHSNLAAVEELGKRV